MKNTKNLNSYKVRLERSKSQNAEPKSHIVSLKTLAEIELSNAENEFINARTSYEEALEQFIKRFVTKRGKFDQHFDQTEREECEELSNRYGDWNIDRIDVLKAIISKEVMRLDKTPLTKKN